MIIAPALARNIKLHLNSESTILTPAFDPKWGWIPIFGAENGFSDLIGGGRKTHFGAENGFSDPIGQFPKINFPD